MFGPSSLPVIPGSTRIVSLLQLISRLSCAIVGMIGCLGLLGWALDIAIFKQIVPGLATMKANTALSLIFAGAALAGLHARPSHHPLRQAGRLFAGAMVVIAVLTLSQYVVGWDLRIDQLLFTDRASVVFPGRMSIVTALSFSLLGLALLLSDVQRADWLVNTLIILALLIAWIAMIGYLYGVRSLYQVFPFSTIAVHTAAALIILGIGTLCARPSHGLAALIANNLATGMMARRLLPAAVLIPLLLGWLRWKGQLAGLYDTEFGLVMMVVATTLVFTAFIWWNARSLNRLEFGRQRIAEALHISEERFRAIFEQAAVGIARVGLQGQWLQVNQKLCDIVGYTRAELLDRTFQAITHPADLDADLAYVDQMLAGEIQTYSMEKRYIRKDHSLVWINLSVSLVRESSGQPKYFIAVINDISDRTQVETALRQSEMRFSKIFRTSPAALAIADVATGRFVDANESYARLLGYRVEELRGHSANELGIHVDTEQPAAIVALVREQGYVHGYEASIRTKLGELRDVLYSLDVIDLDNEPRMLGFLVDITDRKRAEAAQNEAAERLAGIVGSAMDAIVSIDEARNIVLFNAAAEQMFRCSTATVLGQSIDQFIPVHLRDRHAAHVQIFGATGITSRSMRSLGVLTAVRADGDEFPIEATISQVVAAGQKIYTVIMRDITERKHAEASLHQSEVRFAIAFRASPAAMVIAHLEDGSIIDANDSYQRLLGHSREELVDHSGVELNIFRDSEQRAEIVRVLRERGAVHNYETTVHTKSGDLRVVLSSIEIINLGGEACNLVILVDITERKRAEQAIERYTERLKHLRQIDQAMLANRPFEEIAQAALAHIWQMIPCTRVSVVLVDMAAETITLLAVQVNGELRMPPGLQAPIEIIGAAFEPLKQGQVYQVPDIAALPEPPPALRAAQVEHVRGYAYVPIMSDTQLIGLLCLGSDQPGAFPDESIDIAMELAGQLAIAIDQAHLRAEVEQHAAELEQRVAVRTAELAAANQELEAFSYSVSHDLRAPLRAIAGFSRILIEEYMPDLPDEARDYLLLVRDNAQQMDCLINDLLAFARLSRQPLSKQPIAPAELVRQIIGELSGERVGREVEFVIADLPICSADPALLRQVYINLLTNALKFSSKRATARIEVGAQTMTDQPIETVYFVKDNGAGFDMRYAGKLFGVFQRLHRAEDYQGTGVGLAIVQRVIHRHGGRIWAEAAVDRGATFYFTLGGSGSHG